MKQAKRAKRAKQATRVMRAMRAMHAMRSMRAMLTMHAVRPTRAIQLGGRVRPPSQKTRLRGKQPAPVVAAETNQPLPPRRRRLREKQPDVGAETLSESESSDTSGSESSDSSESEESEARPPRRLTPRTLQLETAARNARKAMLKEELKRENASLSLTQTQAPEGSPLHGLKNRSPEEWEHLENKEKRLKKEKHEGLELLVFRPHAGAGTLESRKTAAEWKELARRDYKNINRTDAEWEKLARGLKRFDAKKERIKAEKARLAAHQRREFERKIEESQAVAEARAEFERKKMYERKVAGQLAILQKALRGRGHQEAK